MDSLSLVTYSHSLKRTLFCTRPCCFRSGRSVRSGQIVKSISYPARLRLSSVGPVGPTLRPYRVVGPPLSGRLTTSQVRQVMSRRRQCRATIMAPRCRMWCPSLAPTILQAPPARPPCRPKIHGLRGCLAYGACVPWQASTNRAGSTSRSDALNCCARMATRCASLDGPPRKRSASTRPRAAPPCTATDLVLCWGWGVSWP